LRTTEQFVLLVYFTAQRVQLKQSDLSCALLPNWFKYLMNYERLVKESYRPEVLELSFDHDS